MKRILLALGFLFVTPACSMFPVNPDTGVREFSPAGAARDLRATNVVVLTFTEQWEQASPDVAQAGRDFAAQVEEVALILDEIAAGAEGMSLELSTETAMRALEVLLDAAKIFLDEDSQVYINATLSSTRALLDLVEIYSS